MLVLVCSFMIFSCNKNEPIDYLTNGTWVLDNGATSEVNESVRFKADNTYIFESVLTVPLFYKQIQGTISGEWSSDKSKITFLSSFVNLPNDDSALDFLSTNTGISIGALYGYLQNDTVLIGDLDSIHFDNIRHSEIFPGADSDQWIWTIIKLTKDSLIVDSKGQILKYYNN